MPAEIVLKILGFAQTKREAKKILNTKEIIVDGRKIKSPKFPIGLFDVLTIKETGENFRCNLDEKGQLMFKPIKKENAKFKASKIVGKTVIQGGKFQINLSDARNIISEKTQNKVGDTLLIEVPEQKIVRSMSLEKGAKILLVGGKHAGDTGVVEKIEGEHLVYKNKESIITLKEYAFVLPEEM
jgi:small subunit ribosomal protein S4e